MRVLIRHAVGPALALAAAGLVVGGLAGPAAATGASAAIRPSTVTSVKVGGRPTGMVITRDGARAYVANPGTNAVNVIDIVSRRLVTTIPVGASPQPPALSSDGTKVFVSCQGDNTLRVIDTASNEVTATIPVGAGPGTPAVAAPDRLYVSNVGSNDVSVIDTATNAVVATIAVGAGPTIGVTGTGNQYEPFGGILFVSNTAAGTISIIDTSSNTVTSTVTVGGTITGATVSPVLGVQSQGLYVSTPDAGTVTLMSQPDGALGTTVGGLIQPGVSTTNVTGTRLFVPNTGAASVAVLNVYGSWRVMTMIPVGSGPGTPVLDSAGSSIYVPNTAGSTVSVIRAGTRTVRATYQVGNRPLGLALTPSGATMLVSNSADGTVSVVDTNPKALPTPPTRVTVSTTVSKRARVSWKASTSSGVTGYVVTALPGGRSCTTAASRCTVRGLTAGSTYTFAVQARSRYGAGAPAVSKGVQIRK